MNIDQPYSSEEDKNLFYKKYSLDHKINNTYFIINYGELFKNKAAINPSIHSEEKINRFFSKRELENFSQPMTLTKLLRKKIYRLDSVSDSSFNDLLMGFDKLENIEDELISLILENSAIDTLRYGLKILMIPSPDFSSNKTTKLGSFNGEMRLISLHDHYKDAFHTTLIHELTHSVSYEGDHLPCPVKASEPFNLAYLKFKHCVRKDKASRAMDSSHFFNYIEKVYETDILDKKGLVEIFPFYMEQRVKLRELYPKKAALFILEKQFPYLHSYFETDVKKILLARLKYYSSFLDKNHLTSTNLQANQNKETNFVYQEDGTLAFKKRNVL